MSRNQDDLSVEEKRGLTRLIIKKKNNEVDVDWSEICRRYNLDINADTLRKAGVGIKLADDACMLNENKLGVTAQSNGYVDRQKIRDLTAQVNETFRAQSRSELLRETICEAVKKLPPITVTYAPLHSTPNREKAIVVTMGDFHYGAKIHVKDMFGNTLNKYNHEVFENRMEQLLDQTIDIIVKENVTVVHLFMVGDLIDGMLRQSQLMRLEYGIVDSTMRLAEYLAQWIATLSGHAHVFVHSVSGNHSEIRPLKSKARDFEDENLERILMWYLDARLADNMLVMIDRECGRMKAVSICGYHFLLMHGDGDRNIEQIARDAVNMYGFPIDYFICGHKHSEAEMPAGATSHGESYIIRTPSICGTDSYAASKGFSSRPGALIMVIEANYGRRCVYPINLK